MHHAFSKSVFRCCSLLLLLLLALPGSAGPPKKHKSRGGRKAPTVQEAGLAAWKKKQLANKRKKLGHRMRVVRARIHEAKVKENQITEKIETVEARIGRTRSKLSQTQGHLQTLSERHDEVTKRLHATEDRLHHRRRLLALRLSDNYQRGSTSYTQVLLQSRSLHDLMSRGYYVRKVVQSDSLLIAGVKQDVAQIAQDKKELEAQQAEQERLATEYEAQKRQYVADLGVKQQILHGVQANRAQAVGELDELAQESERMTDVIRQLSETLRRRQEALRMEALAARRKREAARRQEGKPAARRQEEAEPPEIPTWNGDFMRPSDGRRTSGFGYRMHPILGRRRMHTGVDFGASYGSAIRAAASGVVILAQYNHGYGNCIIIDHGNNTTTLYGHASALLVSEGQTVQAGQVIARVGSTGLSTGPHLHFEVRRNGVPVSPPF